MDFERVETLGNRAGDEYQRWDGKANGRLYVILESSDHFWLAASAPIEEDGIARGYTAVAEGRSFKFLDEAMAACEEHAEAAIG